MRSFATLIITLLSMLTTPVAASSFVGYVCPAIATLPPSLKLQPVANGTRQLKQLQTYVANLKDINAAYILAAKPRAKHDTANCMLLHLVSLQDNLSLQRPKTAADQATWLLVANEARAALALIQPRHLYRKPQIRLINIWLAKAPQPQAAPSPIRLTSR